jgi:hypothetical protein
MPRRGRPHGKKGKFTSIQHEAPNASNANVERRAYNSTERKGSLRT